ncbi:MAG: tRNA (adenosine(37)-N6)-threonylcarbamoyltransferase complex dimerization subunit type 1 TsaB [Desulfuromonas sp.]|nr:MAG: tRNA (adenosine(37)-N6)-threonylcarbamoyltransferase complex dimerization subunit type 1 TsaB [Desulfuromonas sp.]
MSLLTIQTAVPAASIALSEDNRILAEFSLAVRRTHADWLVGAIDRLLADACLSVSQLDGLGVVIGPGSFTSLRVGLATVKGLALAAELPIFVVSTLQTLAMQAPFVTLPVCAMLDARKKEVYACRYSWEHGRPRPLTMEKVGKPESIVDECNEPTLFVGDGALVYRPLIVRQLGDRAHFAPDYLNLPRAAGAALLAFDAWQRGEGKPPEQVLPVYLRASEAELNWQG